MRPLPDHLLPPEYQAFARRLRAEREVEVGDDEDAETNRRFEARRLPRVELPTPIPEVYLRPYPQFPIVLHRQDFDLESPIDLITPGVKRWRPADIPITSATRKHKRKRISTSRHQLALPAPPVAEEIIDFDAYAAPPPPPLPPRGRRPVVVTENEKMQVV
jgi:hypothetical protein